MQSILIHHLTGSKANQMTAINCSGLREIFFGREPGCTVQFDPIQDEVVSRQHAKLVFDTQGRFTLIDLKSQNGTFVNRNRIWEATPVQPGDLIQFGPDGPQLRFELAGVQELSAPAPAQIPTFLLAQDRIQASVPSQKGPASRRTLPLQLASRLLQHSSQLPRRSQNPRESVSPLPFNRKSQPPGSFNPAPVPYKSEVNSRGSSSYAQPSIGKNTVMQIVTEGLKSTQRRFVWWGTAMIMVCIVGFSLFWLFVNRTQMAFARELQQTMEEKTNAGTTSPSGKTLTPTNIAGAYTDTTVYIEVGWKLIETNSGKQVFQIQENDKPLFIQFSNGMIEPYLTLDPKNQQGRSNIPIGDNHSGSGFVISNDGFILTNRHVAATWETSYQFQAIPGTLLVLNANNEVTQTKSITGGPTSWVPTRSVFFGGKPLIGKRLEGRNDYLDVTFPKNKLRIPARLVRVSDNHDVAMIKVDTPQSLHKVELNDNYADIQPGDSVTVLGYPALSPNVVVATPSKDPFNQRSVERVVPDVTLSNGHIGRVFRDQELKNSILEGFYSQIGVSYQLTINSTGGGNSGGPVFDDQGRVIGVFYAGSSKVTFAVPIRYGLELMGTSPVIK